MANPSTLFPKIGDIASSTDDKVDADPSDNQEGDGDEKIIQEIESLCMRCHEQGVTRLMLTSIPFFREVIVMSFRCEHCGFQNNEIQSAETIRPEGTVYTAKILDRSDLNRQIVRSGSCEITMPEFDLTLPPTGRGQLTTVEGLIRDIIADLSADQPLRRIQDEEGYKKIEELISKLKPVLGDLEEEADADESKPMKTVGQAAYLELPMPPFTLKLDDPAGNSFIEFIGSMSDPKWSMRTYHRTLAQNVALGLVAPDEEAQEQELTNDQPITDDEVFTFPGVCSSCGHQIHTNMKKVNIPYFKDILIMSTNCEFCGYRDNEVKSGSAISAQGKRITLKCEDRDDLSRDILKSETAGMTIPEIDLVLTHGTLGGRFTTVEGILDQIYDELAEKAFVGDSSEVEERAKYESFLGGLKAVKNAEIPFTIILDDPLANSYIQNLYAPDPDPNMTIEMYDRDFDQNEELGLNDIKVEGYQDPTTEKIDEEGEKKPESETVAA
ncbi:ZPR1 zinc-finger domain-containing protein [Pholiota molesta]|nr:ZPR1 zinc-finger domain-containing protein [Pholiota molesta]